MHKVCYKYLRPKKAEALRKWYDDEFYERNDLGTWSGKNAIILPLRKIENDNLLFGRGGVVDEGGNYVNFSSIDKRIEYSYKAENPVYKDEKVVYCGYLINHWGHFLVEAVSRLWYFLKNDETVDKYVFFIEENATREIKGNYKEFLQLLGVWDKLEVINTPTLYKEVIVPELGYKWRRYYSKEFLDIFNTVAENAIIDNTWVSSDKIYFSRSKLSKANGNEFGLESIDDFYHKNGYMVLSPEKITLSQMIYYVRNAKICASLSGSLPHNMLFASDDQKLVIIERCVLNNEIQVDINKMKKFDVTYVDANIPIYTVNMSGPFIMAFNCLTKNYANDNRMVAPAPRYYSEKYMNKCFKNYMKSYIREYGYRWYMLDWYIDYTGYLWEAYEEGYKQFSKFLSGEKPFLWYHYFEWRYIKRVVKSFLKHLKK